MKRLIILSLSTSLLSFGASAYAHTISQAKAAELSLHRVERLVILKRIEESFETKAQSVKVELLAHQTENDPVFKATIAQVPGADGSQKQVEIVLNGEGKALQNTVLPGGTDPVGAPVWPDKDAVTLAENALHYILEGALVKPELAPYNDYLVSLTLNQVADAAVVDVFAGEGVPVLRIRLKLDGSVASAEFVQ